MRSITITISEVEESKRFMRSTWKAGRSVENDKVVKQVYNMQADTDDDTDGGLVHDMFLKRIWEGIDVISEYLSSEPVFGDDKDLTVTITLSVPENWTIHSAPGLKYAMRELIHNGMLADWYDDTRPDAAKTFKQSAELNKAQMQSIIYSLNAPS